MAPRPRAAAVPLAARLLLALGAINEAAAASLGFRGGPALALAAEGQRLRGVRQPAAGAQPATAAAVHAGNETHPYDEAPAREAFVKQCAEVVRAETDETLPVDALESFCETTDAVVECRMRVVQGLKDAHRQGHGLEAFCAEAYAWFQTKYGGYCPAQCHKIQCRSTCRWLDDKKKLETQKSEAQGELKKSKGLKKQLGTAEKALAATEKEALELKHTLTITETQVARAAALRQEREQVWSAVKEEAAVAKSKADQRQDELEQVEANITSDEDILDRLRKRIDSDVISHESKLDEVKRAEVSLEKSQEGLGKQREKADGLQKELRAAAGEAAKRSSAMQALEGEVASQRAVVEEHSAAVRDAESKLRAEGDGAAAKVKETLEVLVNEQTSRLKEAAEKLSEIEQRRVLLEADITNANTAANGLKEDLSGIKRQSASEKKKADKLSDELEASKSEARTMAAALASRRQEATVRDKKLAKLEKRRVKAQKTLQFAGQAAQEQVQKLNVAKEAIDQAAAMHDIVQGVSARLLAKLEETAKEVHKMAHEEAQLSSKYENMSGAAVRQLEAIRKASNQLDVRKPDTVRQHDLGLFRLLHG